MSTKRKHFRHRAGAYRSPCGQVLRVRLRNANGEPDPKGEPVFLVRCAPKEVDKMEGVDEGVDFDFFIEERRASGAVCWGAAQPCDMKNPTGDAWGHLGEVKSFETTPFFGRGTPFVGCIEHEGVRFVREGYVDRRTTVMIPPYS